MPNAQKCTLITCHCDPLASTQQPLALQQSAPLTMGHYLDLRDAIAFARGVHAGQKRANGRAFLSHPLAVLQILRAASTHLPHAAYVAALLHDTVEDGRATVEHIRIAFGEDVANAVDALTRTTLPKGMSVTDHEHDYLARMVRAHALLPYILHIKMADRLHNLETVQYLPHERQLATVRTTVDLYLPLLRHKTIRLPAYAASYELLLAQLEESLKNHLQKP